MTNDKAPVYLILENTLIILYLRQLTFEDDVTPYIHVFVNHVAYFIRKFGCLGPFEMEAVEQLNYVNKLVFFKASNHGKGNSPYTITEQVSVFNILYKNPISLGTC